MKQEQGQGQEADQVEDSEKFTKSLTTKKDVFKEQLLDKIMNTDKKWE